MAENYEIEEEFAEAEPTELGFEIVSWETPEYQKHDRRHWWYVLYAIIGVAMLIYAIVTSNFLFAIIIIVGSLILIFNDARHPGNVTISITTEGVLVGNRFYDYDEMHHFAIVYKPMNDLRRLYIEFKSSLRHRLSVSLHDVDPLFVRDNLLKYLPEDLDRTHEPLSETLTRLLKL